MSTATQLRGDISTNNVMPTSSATSLFWPIATVGMILFVLISLTIHFSMIQELRGISNDLLSILSQHEESYSDIQQDIQTPAKKVRLRASASANSFFETKKDV